METSRFLVVPADERHLDALLVVYRQSEDFLALGPIHKASAQMVTSDIESSRKEGGLYCGVWDKEGVLFGVLCFVPKMREETSFLTLLMISASYRGRGLGSEIVVELEKHLKTHYSTRRIEAGVQVNNLGAIRFWARNGFRLDDRPKALADGTVCFDMAKEIA